MHYQVHGHVHVGHVHVKQAFEYLRTCTLPSASNGTQTQDTLHFRQSALPLSYQGSSAGWPQISSHSKLDEQANNQYVYLSIHNAVKCVHLFSANAICNYMYMYVNVLRLMIVLFLILQPTESELACSVFVDGEK